MVLIFVILHNFHPVINLDFINHGCHSWSVAREVVNGGIVGRRINAFVFAGLNDLNNVVVVRLLQLQVNTQKFSEDAGAGIGVGFDEAFIVVEIVFVPIVYLPFAIEEYEGTRFILLCMASSPVVDDRNCQARSVRPLACVEYHGQQYGTIVLF